MTDSSGFISSPTDDRTEIVRLDDRFWHMGNSWNLVSDRFDVTANYAASSYETTNTFVEAMGTLISELERYNIPSINVDSPEVTDIDYNTRPTVGSVEMNETFPDNTAEKPDIGVFPELTPINLPNLSVTAPEYATIEKPQPSNIAEPGDAPVPKEIVIPSPIEIKLPPAPVIKEAVLIPAPVITIPKFESTFVDEIINDPTPMTWEESPFNSDIWNSLLNKVIDGIENGGTGLNPEVEAEIWARAQNRQQEQNDETYQEIENYFSSRNYELPAGAMAGRLAEAAAKIDRNNTELNGNIAIEQGQLAQKNTHFMLELGRQSEVILRDFHNAQMGRSLEAAKSVAANAIDILN